MSSRDHIPEMEKVVDQFYKILDHGFVRVIDYMGSDSAIVQAARVSYGSGTKTLREDRGLIRYLMKHKHTSPFEMCEIKFHLKMPLFVARQWIRHRTANLNECSARYSVLPKEFYIPEPALVSKQSSDNKQGRGEPLNEMEAQKVIESLVHDSEACYNTYQSLINSTEEGITIDESKEGIARELGRINLTLNYYTELYWKIDLHNLLHFLNLRMHPHAQYEIRVYADKIFELIKEWCPLTIEAFEEFILNGVNFSVGQIRFIKALIEGKNPLPEEVNLSKREHQEVLDKLQIK